MNMQKKDEDEKGTPSRVMLDLDSVIGACDARVGSDADRFQTVLSSIDWCRQNYPGAERLLWLSESHGSHADWRIALQYAGKLGFKQVNEGKGSRLGAIKSMSNEKLDLLVGDPEIAALLPDVRVVLVGGKGPIGKEEWAEWYGCGPSRVLEVFALTGMPSLGVKGVPGVGVSMASQWLEQGSLEEIFSKTTKPTSQQALAVSVGRAHAGDQASR